jgi:stage II sporulation protein M
MFKKNLIEAKQYVVSIKKEVWYSAFLFLLSCLAGYLFAEFFPERTAEYLEEIKKFFESIDQTTDFQTFISIFENNASAMLTIVCLGVFAGFFSITFLFINGFLFGLLAQIIFQRESWVFFFSGVFPHGIIEIPCMLFAAAVGFKVGSSAVKKLIGNQADLTEDLAQGLKFSVTVIIPLLFVAAFLETYITPLFMALAGLIF